MKLPIGSNYLRCKSFHPKDDNSVITNFYQIGPLSYRSCILADLLVMITQEPLFDNLRNKEQLGYDVSCSVNDNYGILAYNIAVNSQETKYSCEYVDQRIESFRQELISIIETMPGDDFDAMKASLAKCKLAEDNKLYDEVTRNWAEITIHEYKFDRHYKEVECLASISKTDLIEFYKSHSGENDRKLSVHVIGNKIDGTDPDYVNGIDSELDFNKDEDIETHRKSFDSITHVDFSESTKGNVIKDLIEFKNTLEIYPVARTKE